MTNELMYLSGKNDFKVASIVVQMRWMAGGRTKRVQDIAQHNSHFQYEKLSDLLRREQESILSSLEQDPRQFQR